MVKFDLYKMMKHFGMYWPYDVLSALQHHELIELLQHTTGKIHTRATNQKVIKACQAWWDLAGDLIDE